MTVHKYTSLAIGLIYLVFAGLQYNDPDAVLWIFIYLSAAILSFYSFRGQYNQLVLIILGLLYLLGALYYWPAEFQGFIIGGGDIANIERARESAGLLSCLAVTVYFYIRSFRQMSSEE